MDLKELLAYVEHLENDEDMDPCELITAAEWLRKCYECLLEENQS
jgi:hypothetical protein